MLCNINLKAFVTTRHVILSNNGNLS